MVNRRRKFAIKKNDRVETVRSNFPSDKNKTNSNRDLLGTPDYLVPEVYN